MTKDSAATPAVRATEFESRRIYHSSQTPGYSSWVSFFPGERGQWYLTCEEVTIPETPLPKCSRQQWYEIGLPAGYDKSQYLMEAVIFESTDNMKTWKEISREPYHHQHSVHQFATARTKDGRFLRFIWSCYSLDPSVRHNEIFYESSDNGKTWKKMPPFHHERFVSSAHRLRTLTDGTLVLAIPLSQLWGHGTTERPVRAASNLNYISHSSMCLYFSCNQGHTWEGPLPIYGGQQVSETDFVELPDGNLLFINNSIFANPGRQFVYRDGKVWTPGPLERARGQVETREPNMVPETVCLTEDGILVGCLRAGRYSWSDDLGINWQPLAGVPDTKREVYQPWIHYLGNNRFACAGHYGRDAPISGDDKDDQYISIHFFTIEVLRKTKKTKIEIERDYDETANRWKNAYTIRLLCGGEPVAGKELDFWYVERNQPGYDSWNKDSLADRMKMGGKLIKLRSAADGIARVSLEEFDSVENVHLSYQFVVRFNSDRQYAEYKPVQSHQFSFYAIHYQDPPL